MGNPRRTNGSRRNAVRRVVLRQESSCHLCGGWVDKSLPQFRDGSPEVDELVPVSLGGSPYDRANCRLAHRYCNRFRWYGPVLPAQQALHAKPPIFDGAGNRIAVKPSPVVSRQW